MPCVSWLQKILIPLPNEKCRGGILHRNLDQHVQITREQLEILTCLSDKLSGRDIANAVRQALKQTVKKPQADAVNR